MIFDGMVNGETDPELIEDIEEVFIEDYIPLPRQYDMNEYRMNNIRNRVNEIVDSE